MIATVGPPPTSRGVVVQPGRETILVSERIEGDVDVHASNVIGLDVAVAALAAALIGPAVDAALRAGSVHTHDQPTPSATWTVQHGLTVPISAVHVTSAGVTVWTDWSETTPGTVIIEFGAPASGTAQIS